MAQILVCDICGKSPAKQISLCVGAEMGPAGSTDGVYEQIDICFDCLVKRINYNIRDIDLRNKMMEVLQGKFQ
jgi:hypothetical protein